MSKFKIFPNAYYNFLKGRKESYLQEKVKVQKKMVKLYHENNGTVGAVMMSDYLKLNGNSYSVTTVRRYMQELNLKSTIRQAKPGYLKGNAHHVFPNLLNRKFNVTQPNKIWVTDFTYLKQADGSMRYNCTILDLYKREAIATLNSSHIDAQLAMDTLAIALKRRKPKKGLIFHSDQGTQFTSKDFIEFCRKNHIQQSMSRAGCPQDNAVMERFYGTLKYEFFHLFTFKTQEICDQQTYDFVYVKYNYKRPHRYNNGLPPSIAVKHA